MKVYNSSSLALFKSFTAHSSWINRIKQSPFNSGQYVATCSDDSQVKIWDCGSSWTLIRTFTGHTSFVFGLEWINEDTIASGSYDSTIKIWSLSTGQTQRTINAGSSVLSLVLMSNQIHLAAGLENGNINIFNINDASLVVTIRAHTYDVYDVALIGSYLMSSSNNAEIKIWNLTTYTNKYNLTGHSSGIRSLKRISSTLLASGSYDRTIKLWDITNGTLIRTLTNHTDDIRCSIDVLNDGSQTLVSGSADQTIKMWDISSGQVLNTIQTGLYINALALITSNQTSTSTSNPTTAGK
jgi:WD40 repeat protein